MASFEHDLVVIRGLLTAAQIRLVDTRLSYAEEGRPLTRTQSCLIARMIPELGAARRAIRQGVGERWGREQVRAMGRYVHKPDTLRRGGMEAHIDDLEFLTAMSVNLTGGPRGSAEIRAERVADASAPYDEIAEAAEERLQIDEELRTSVTLGLGDAVFLGRGVLHEIVADPYRLTVLASSRDFSQV